MDNKKNILLALNDLLETEGFEKEKFNDLIRKLKTAANVDFKFYDFEYYNEVLCESLKQDKIKKVKMQNFSGAAGVRDTEKKCLDYIELRKYLAVTNSKFIIKDGVLLYCYFGTARNDKTIRNFIK